MRSLLKFFLFIFIATTSLGFVQAGEGSANKSQVKKGQFLGAKPTEYPDWFKESFLDFKEDVADATAAGKRVLVLFHQDGCPYCNAVVEQNLAQKDIETLVRKNFDVIALNMWGDREIATIDGKTYTEKEFAAALKVQFTPTMLFFNESGKLILRLNGYLPPRRFKVALEYIANKEESKSSYRDYVAKHLPAGKSSGKLHAEDFFVTDKINLGKTHTKPFAIFIEQKDCPACDTLHSKILVDKGIRETLKDFTVYQLDMWSDKELTDLTGKKTTARKFAKSLDVKYAPSILVFNQQGEEVIRSEAFFKTFHTHGILTYVSSGAYIKQPSFQRYLTDRAHDIQAEGKNVDLWHMDSGKK
ncbi:thioredoxin SoxW [hydrothermal vent metagenome]|uniref:Thioredoxin SoxW n=1 Tax=hydrothermal vent metagenome TaxID=652676 RepID=A0A3B0ZPA6_9ZZZZ